MNKFFIELSNRWAQDGPKWFNRLKRFGAFLSALSAFLLVLPTMLSTAIPGHTINLGAIDNIAGYALVLGATMSFVASTAVKDPDYSTLSKPKEIPPSAE